MQDNFPRLGCHFSLWDAEWSALWQGVWPRWKFQFSLSFGHSFMLTHDQIWNAIDLLAKKHSLSTSGLAKKAGLDPTTFNRSKRLTNEGKLRWPSTESVSKILAATNSDLAQFVALIQSGAEAKDDNESKLKTIEFVEASRSNPFDTSGFAGLGDWTESDISIRRSASSYCLSVELTEANEFFFGKCKLEIDPTLPISANDKVVFMDRNYRIGVAIVKKKTSRQTVLKKMGGDFESSADVSNVFWMASIRGLIFG